MNKIHISKESKDAIIDALNKSLSDSKKELRIPVEFSEGIEHSIKVVESFPESDEWISVTEKLPEGDQEVLVFAGYYQYVSSYLQGRWWVFGDDELVGITHWKPLPNPPTSHK